MEQNLPIVTKKLWNKVRLALYMLRKGMWKNKLLLDLNLMMKQGKLAGKTLFINLMFHYHYASASKASVGGATHLACDGLTEDEFFSCTNTPLYFTNDEKKNHQNYSYDVRVIEAMNNGLLEMLSGNEVGVKASSVMPRFGFGRSTMVRQIRITDSPYPLQNDNGKVEEFKYVDKTADAFIKRFYSQLKHQSY